MVFVCLFLSVGWLGFLFFLKKEKVKEPKNVLFITEVKVMVVLGVSVALISCIMHYCMSIEDPHKNSKTCMCVHVYCLTQQMNSAA